MTDYILTADFFDQIVERRPDRTPLRIVKHRRGAILDDLTDADAERLLSTGAIKPYVEPGLDIDDEDDEGQGGDSEGETAETGAPAADAVPGDGDPGTEDGTAAAEPSTTPERPLKTAGVAEWRKYATDVHGLPKDEAADLNRAELISRYGG